MEFETFVIIVAVVVIVLVATASTRRRGGFLPQRMCRSCGASHPSFAQFCRRCGQRL
jgi:ribosomal protein L40E